MKHYCPECKSMAKYKDEENYSDRIVCDLCKDKLFKQWAKEDSGDGSYIVFQTSPPQQQKPLKVSVIIPTRSGISQQLKENLFNQTYKPYEIIEVIGSALTVQRNEGIKVATGDIFVFIDDDIILRPDFIEEIIKPFSLFKTISAVSGNPQVKTYKTNIFIYCFYELYAHIFMLTYRDYGKYQLSGFPTNYWGGISHLIKSEMLHGCCMAVKREVFEKYRFNENLVSRMYGEDDYFANEIIREYNILYNPNAICYDNRPYPKGKQAVKIRSTIYNLIIRHKRIKRTLLEKVCFIWAMLGFIIFKITEAIIMKDISIIKGILLCFKKYEDVPLEDIRRNIKINIYKGGEQWQKQDFV